MVVPVEHRIDRHRVAPGAGAGIAAPPDADTRCRSRRAALATPRLGRIVGTVIDLTTGAPVAGMTVRINDQELLTDTNGNYGRENLMPGTYVVELIVPPERGTSVQGAIPITLPEGETARQDLAFRSPARVAAPEPSGDAAPVPPPATLPATGASNEAPWMAVLGMILLAGGVLIARRATP
jgi:LPXTG-motif cell wall-anchored protein